MRKALQSFAMTALTAIAVVGSAHANPTFNLTYIAGTSAQAQTAFAQAAAYWTSAFSDNVTINLTVGTGTLGSGILASAASAESLFFYSGVRTAMATDATSTLDTAAVAHLPNTSSIPIYMNYTSDNPNGSGSATPYLDSTGVAVSNNTTVRMTNANAKALGLTPTLQTVNGCSSNCDGFIEFSNGFTYDFDRGDGITGGTYDFVGLAMHEIGHALGFISGVDILDINSTSPTFFAADLFTYVSPLDLFRCSTASATAGATLDFTAGTATKSFSTDNCATALGTFSTGQVHGDGRQASHWKDNLSLGIMDPTAATGEFLNVTALDLKGFDVIGWNLTTVPEPGALLLGAGWLIGLAAARRRR